VCWAIGLVAVVKLQPKHVVCSACKREYRLEFVHMCMCLCLCLCLPVCVCVCVCGKRLAPHNR
jgi:hypothetical protein